MHPMKQAASQCSFYHFWSVSLIPALPLPVLPIKAIMERICELCLAWQMEREAPTKFTLLKKLCGKITTRVSSASFLDSRPSLVMFEILLGERYNMCIYIYTYSIYPYIPPRKKHVYTLQGTNISHPWEKENHLQNMDGNMLVPRYTSVSFSLAGPQPPTVFAALRPIEVAIFDLDLDHLPATKKSREMMGNVAFYQLRTVFLWNDYMTIIWLWYIMNSLRDAANSNNVRMGKTLGIVLDAKWWNLSPKIETNSIFSSNILLVEEILHQLISSLSHHLQGFIHLSVVFSPDFWTINSILLVSKGLSEVYNFQTLRLMSHKDGIASNLLAHSWQQNDVKTVDREGVHVQCDPNHPPQGRHVWIWWLQYISCN